MTGSPILEGSLAHVDCTIHQVHEAGDHYVVIGRVVDLGIDDAVTSTRCCSSRGKYRTTDAR